jgi:hypothetical protein
MFTSMVGVVGCTGAGEGVDDNVVMGGWSNTGLVRCRAAVGGWNRIGTKDLNQWDID